MTLHVYAARAQPATRYTVHLGEKKLVMRTKPRCLLPCSKCNANRIAANLVAHVYYDGTWFYCKPGKGCRA